MVQRGHQGSDGSLGNPDQVDEEDEQDAISHIVGEMNHTEERGRADDEWGLRVDLRSHMDRPRGVVTGRGTVRGSAAFDIFGGLGTGFASQDVGL